MKERNKTLEKFLSGLDILGKCFLIFIMAFPFFWMISTALQTLQETIAVPITILPESPQWENFATVFKTINVWAYLKNSIIVCVSVVVLQYFIIVPCAYSLAKFDYKAKPLIFALVMLGQMIPMQITFLPVYFMFSKIGWLNSYQSLILPFISNPFGIFMLRQYFMQVPSMVKSALVTIGLLAFISNWNNYFWPLIMTGQEKMRTLPIGIALLKDSDNLQRWNVIMAGNLLLVLPMLGLYIGASKKIRNAFVYSGIK